MDLLRLIKDTFFKKPGEFNQQLAQLKASMSQNPLLPLALPEQYILAIGGVEIFEQRIECWSFTRGYQERARVYKQALTDFHAVIECLLNSQSLPALLGLILAVGNFLNGGTNRGRADGFSLDSIPKLESVKDPNGKDVRDYIFRVFFLGKDSYKTVADLLIDELRPLFLNTVRTMQKDSDGIEKIAKRTRVCLEDFEQLVVALQKEYTEMNETMITCLQYCTDPTNPFKREMPAKFAEAKTIIDALVVHKDMVGNSYKSLMMWFAQDKPMKSSDFCLLWDDLFIPGDLIINKGEKMKKTELIPRFCKPRALCTEDILILWEYRKPGDGKKKEKTPSRKRQGRRGVSVMVKDGIQLPDDSSPSNKISGDLDVIGEGE